jgi:hypothetical protein
MYCMTTQPNGAFYKGWLFLDLLYYIIYYIILSLYYPCVLYSKTKDKSILVIYEREVIRSCFIIFVVIDVVLSFRNGGDKLPLRSQGRHLHFASVLRIHDILVWIRIRGSMPLTNGSGSRRPKNMWIRWIRIRFASYKKESHFFLPRMPVHFLVIEKDSVVDPDSVDRNELASWIRILLFIKDSEKKFNIFVNVMINYLFDTIFFPLGSKITS